MQAELFWQTLGGTMGITCTITRTVSQIPVVDLSTVNAARIRLRRSGADAVNYTATVVGLPTATSITIRHAFVPGDLTVGTYSAWGVVSVDDGTSWYPSEAGTLTVVDT